MLTRINHCRRWLALFTGCLLVSLAQAEPFPRPPEFEPDIGFWRKVFTEIDTNQAYLHDNRQLDIIYSIIEYPADAGVAERRKIADRERDLYIAALEALAAGQTAALTPEMERVKASWPADTTRAQFRDAAKRIRAQQGLSDRFLAGLQRSGAWRPFIDEQLARHGVPTGLGALPHVESSFNPEARSHVGAAGLWQFMRPTGLQFMMINDAVDERRDPFFSSEAAARLLAYNYSVLDSWPLAITAYNHGAGGMRRAVEQMGTTDIVRINREYNGRAFGFSSRNFYPSFLAALEVESNAEKYFGPVTREAPATNSTVRLPGYAPVGHIVAATGVPAATLRALNPSLLEPVWQGKRHIPRNYRLRVPPGTLQDDPAAVLAAIRVQGVYARQTADEFHRVRPGESLSVIASRYSTSVAELVALNNLNDRHRIRAGQNLRLPGRVAGTAQAGATTYKVRPGDTLSVIARRTGVSETQLLRLNQLADRNRIFVGQVLQLTAQAETTSRNDPTGATAGVRRA